MKKSIKELALAEERCLNSFDLEESERAFKLSFERANRISSAVFIAEDKMRKRNEA